MALIQDTYLTDKGFEIANKAANGQTSFTITKIVSSDQNINDKSKDEIKKLNNLNNEINSGQIIDTDVKSSNLTGIVTQFGNDIYTKGYEVGAIAMYAKENNSDNEFLYAVTPMVENEKIPAVDTNVFLGFQVTIYVVAGDSQRMDVSLSKGGDASVDLVEKLISNSESGTQKKLDEVNKRVDSLNLGKADKSDLKQLQDNVGGDLQNRLTSLNNGKADKVTVYSKNDVDNKDTQTFNSANSYTDSKYNDLLDKNDILSQKMEDYQKPNLVDRDNEYIHTGGWTSNAGAGVPVQVEKGKTYSVSVLNQGSQGGQVELMSGNNGIYSSDEKIPIAQTKYIDDFTITQGIWNSDRDALMYVYFQTNGGGDVVFKDVCVTETSTYVPYSIAEQNKASIQSEGMLTTDYQAPNLVDDTDDWISLGKGNNSINQGTVQLKANKSYWFSIDYNYDSSQQGGTTLSIWCLGKQSGQSVILSYNKNWGSKLSQSIQYTPNSDENITFYVQINGDTNNTGSFRHLTVTQSDDYVPYEVAQRNRLWNDRISNKTDILSQQIKDSHTDLNNAKADKYNTYTKNDIDEKVDNVNSRVTDLNNGKADKTNVYSKNDIDGKVNDLNNNKQDKSDSTNKFKYLNTVKANTDDMNEKDKQVFNNANSYTDNKVNDIKDKYFGVGTINNGYNLDGFTWNGTFSLSNVDMDTLQGISGFAPGYKGFYGVLKVEAYNGYVRQFLYDNIGGAWYRYLGNGSQWQEIDNSHLEQRLASIRQNSWRELETNSYGFDGKVVCKPDFNNNTVTLLGILRISKYYAAYNINEEIVNSKGQDFKFNGRVKGNISITVYGGATGGSIAYPIFTGNNEDSLRLTTDSSGTSGIMGQIISLNGIKIPIIPK